LRRRFPVQLALALAKSQNPTMRSPCLRRGLLLLLCLTLAVTARAGQDYPPDVKSVIEQRCMVCHGCYDAPCQLKLDAWAGLQRGASKDKVYDGTRLRTANLTRLFEDAHSIGEWRDKGFYPVLTEQSGQTAVLRGMLELKQRHPLPPGKTLPDSFDLSLDRNQQCPKPGEFASFAQDHPLWGMPYGLPGLNSDEHRVLLDWLERNAPGVPAKAASPAEARAIADWEAFLNGTGRKRQLMARYIFEHLFIGNLYFSDLEPRPGFYQLVRSRTPPGQPVDIIATRRPYDSPGKGPFYYRLQPLRTAILDKRHMPYALNKARMKHWRALFLDAEYDVKALPGYRTAEASNPFVTFRDLPVTARYEFMLDEALFTIMGFIKGPVCRGQVALNVIDDHFWVMFVAPEQERSPKSAEFLARESGNLRLPSGKSGLLVSLVEWRRYSRDQLKFLRAKMDFLRDQLDDNGLRVNADLIWDGDGHNDNATLTVFRHNDSASVIKGLVGQVPKTAWVIDYSLLERIHYLLVAGFDVFGNVGHQLETRLYMDFLRMEGEQNFLFFMPGDERVALRDFWYRDAGDHVKQYVLSDTVAFDRDSDIVYRTDDPKRELLLQLRESLHGARAQRYAVDEPAFARLAGLDGRPFSLMPEVAFVEVFGARGEERVYTLLHNSGYSNNAQLFREEQRRIPEEDYLTVVTGFVGSYPNVFFQVPEQNLEHFVTSITELENEDDYSALVDRYGTRRNATWFWRLSDKFHARYRRHHPVEAGLFDLNRYENR
jgi:hypothetical protein